MLHEEFSCIQDGNGGAAIAGGRHSSQAGMSKIELMQSINAGRLQQNFDAGPFDAQSPVVNVIPSEAVGNILVSDSGPSEFGGNKAYEFKVNDKKVEVLIGYDKGQSPIGSGDLVEVSFSVNNQFSTARTSSRDNVTIANTVSQIFRNEVKVRPEGTLFSASASTGDSRGAFREAMYARAGLSFGGGSPTPSQRSTGDRQYGAKINGRLVPSDRSRVFTAEEQRSHKAAVRDSVRAGIRAAREIRDRSAS